jgi:hypothetical protein
MITRTVNLETDRHNNLVLPLDEQMLQALGCKPGDRLCWKINDDGSWTISKAVTEFVLVDTIETFHKRYVIEVPVGKADWAVDTVCSEEAKEFSQTYLGETVVDHRVVHYDEAMNLCDEVNPYAKNWTEDRKVDAFFTTMGKQP